MNTPETASSEEPACQDAAATRPAIFYGWVVVGLAFTILCVAYGIQFTFGVFLPAISADTGWDRTSLSLPYSLYVFVYSALGIVTGWCTDRWGPRIVIIMGGCLLGSGILLTSQAQALWQLYIFLGLIAAFGMSAAFVPCNATVVRWFTQQRGLALSIASSGASLGNFLFPPVAAALIAAYGWRTTYVTLGLFGMVLIIGCAMFIVRDPEWMGLHPDGQEPPAPLPGASPSLSQASGAEWTLASARRTSAFWLLTAVFTMTWLVVFMPVVHIVPFAVDLGVPQVRAATLISVIGLGGLIGRLLTGAVSDRLGRLPTLGLSLSLQVLAFLGFLFSTGLTSLYPAAVIFGLAYGGATTLFPAIVGDFFGRLAVGAIVGFIFSVAGSTAAFGPFIAGYIYDATGSYNAAFALSAGLNLIGVLLLFLLKKPHTAAAYSDALAPSVE